MTTRPIVRVVAAMLVESGRVLIARRGPGMDLAGCWEFPGGKLEPGESAAAALTRELAEELSLAVRPDGWLANSELCMSGRRIRLEGWLATRIAGVPRAREHDAWCWILPQDIVPATLAPADRPLLDALLIRASRGGGVSQDGT